MIRVLEHQVWFASYVALWGVPMRGLHNQQISLISLSQAQTVAASVHSGTTACSKIRAGCRWWE